MFFFYSARFCRWNELIVLYISFHLECMWVVTTLSTESLAKPTHVFHLSIGLWWSRVTLITVADDAWATLIIKLRDDWIFPLPSTKSPHFSANYNLPNTKSSWFRLLNFIIVNSDITTRDDLTRGCSYWWFQNPRAPATRRGGKFRWRGLGLGLGVSFSCESYASLENSI